MAPINVASMVSSLVSTGTHILEARNGASTSSTSNNIVYIAVGASIGGVLLIAIITVLYLIFRARRKHQIGMSYLESGRARHSNRPMSEISHSDGGVRCGDWFPWSAQTVGNAVEANTWTAPSGNGDNGRSTGGSTSQHETQRCSPRSGRHLSAIPESPRTSTDWGLEQFDDVSDASPASRQDQPIGQISTFRNGEWMRQSEQTDERPETPVLSVWPSFAIPSPSRYGVALATKDDNPRANRAVSTSVLSKNDRPHAPSDNINRSTKQQRSLIHPRSLSLGGSPSRPPVSPVPPLPLPVIPPVPVSNRHSFRNGLVVALSKTSSITSIGSVDSAVLFSNLRLKGANSNQNPTPRASVENVNRLSKPSRNSHRIRPNESVTSVTSDRQNVSVRGSIFHQSNDSNAGRPLSDFSLDSGDSMRNRMSVPQIATADSISFTPANGVGTVQQIQTPVRKASHRKPQVSASGSPYEQPDHKHASSRRNFSRRNVSISTQSSSDSNNGNLFKCQCGSKAHHTAPKQSPRRSKGSPNSRKGHRRGRRTGNSALLTPSVLSPLTENRSASPELFFEYETPGSSTASASDSSSPSNRRGVQRQDRIKADQTSSILSQFPTPTTSDSQQPETPCRPRARRSRMVSPTLGSSSTGLSSPFPLRHIDYDPSPASVEDSSLADLSPVSPLDLPSSPPLPVGKIEGWNSASSNDMLAIASRHFDPASPPTLVQPKASSWFHSFAAKSDQNPKTSSWNRSTVHTVKNNEHSSTPQPETEMSSRLSAPFKAMSENLSSMVSRIPGGSSSRASHLGVSETSFPSTETLCSIPYELTSSPCEPRAKRRRAARSPASRFGRPPTPAYPTKDQVAAAPTIPRPLSIPGKPDSRTTSPDHPLSPIFPHFGSYALDSQPTQGPKHSSLRQHSVRGMEFAVILQDIEGALRGLDAERVAQGQASLWGSGARESQRSLQLPRFETGEAAKRGSQDAVEKKLLSAPVDFLQSESRSRMS